MTVTLSEREYTDLQLIRQRDAEYLDAEHERIKQERVAVWRKELDLQRSLLASARADLTSAQAVLVKARVARDKAKAKWDLTEDEVGLALRAKGQASGRVMERTKEVEMLERELRGMGEAVDG